MPSDPKLLPPQNRSLVSIWLDTAEHRICWGEDESLKHFMLFLILITYHHRFTLGTKPQQNNLLVVLV